MIHWFLSLFRPYRDLLETERDLRFRLSEAARRGEQADQDCNSWREQAMWMRDAMVTAQKEATASIQAVANIEYQRRYGWVPFPQAMSIPDKWFEDQEGLNPIARPSPMLPFQERQDAAMRFREQGIELAKQAFHEAS